MIDGDVSGAPRAHERTELLRALQDYIIGEVTHPAKSVLWLAGDWVPYLYLVKSGWMLQYNLLIDGRRQIYAFPIAGDLLSPSLLVTPVAPYCFQSITATTLVQMDRKRLMSAMAASGALHELVQGYFSSLETATNRHLLEIGRMNAAERIASFLLRMIARLESAKGSSSSSYEMPLTRSMVSDALGLTPIHVTRILKLMERDGILKWHRGILDIREPDRLKRLPPTTLSRKLEHGQK